MSDTVQSKELKDGNRRWSILGDSYEPGSVPVDFLRLMKIEDAISFLPTEESVCRSWATHLVLMALEMVDPELADNPEREATVTNEIAKYSHRFMDYDPEKIAKVASSAGLQDGAPIMQALDDIFKQKITSGRNIHGTRVSIAEVAGEVPEASQSLVRYVFIQQQGFDNQLRYGAEDGV